MGENQECLSQCNERRELKLRTSAQRMDRNVMKIEKDDFCHFYKKGRFCHFMEVVL